MTENIYEIEVTGIDGSPYRMERHRGKVILVVNTASQCGYTPQYAGLENLQKAHGEQGFIVLGFPCNQFGRQEPGNNLSILNFCKTRFGITFPMHQKVHVNGPNTHPLFAFLKSRAKGILGTQQIKWNFTKFLIGRNGEVLQRFSPRENPKNIQKNIQIIL